MTPPQDSSHHRHHLDGSSSSSTVADTSPTSCLHVTPPTRSKAAVVATTDRIDNQGIGNQSTIPDTTTTSSSKRMMMKQHVVALQEDHASDEFSLDVNRSISQPDQVNHASMLLLPGLHPRNNKDKPFSTTVTPPQQQYSSPLVVVSSIPRQPMKKWHQPSDEERSYQDSLKPPPRTAATATTGQAGAAVTAAPPATDSTSKRLFPIPASLQTMTRAPPRSNGGHDDEEEDNRSTTSWGTTETPVIAIGIPNPAPPQQPGTVSQRPVPTTAAATLVSPSPPPPRRSIPEHDESTQQTISRVVAENIAEEEHNTKCGLKVRMPDSADVVVARRHSSFLPEPKLAAAVASSTSPATPHASSTSNAKREPRDDMLEAKRRERQRALAASEAGMMGAAAAAPVCNPESNIRNSIAQDMHARRLQRTSIRQAAAVAAATCAVTPGIAIAGDKDQDVAANKKVRLAPARAPSLADSSAFCNISSTSVLSEKTHGHKDVVRLSVRTKSGEIASASEDEADNEPVLALAVARAPSTARRSRSVNATNGGSNMASMDSRLAKEAAKMSHGARGNPGLTEEDDDEGGPSLAPPRANLKSATSSTSVAVEPERVKPGAVAMVTPDNQQAKGVDGPGLAPAFAAPSLSVTLPNDSEVPSNTSAAITASENHGVIQVQTGIAVALPGAFAVDGINNNRNNHDDDSSQGLLDDDVELGDGGGRATTAVGANDPSSEFFDPEGQDLDNIVIEDAALQAELHEAVVVEGAVVTDDDEDETDPKVLRRIRMIQAGICFFSVAAAVLVGLSVSIGFKPKGPMEKVLPTIRGWAMVGKEIFGPITNPQSVFGSNVKISADGKRIAATAPGTNTDDTTRNVGQVRIFDAQQGDNGTDWILSEPLEGLRANTRSASSLAMSNEGSRVVVGYPLMNGGYIQTFDTDGSKWFSTAVLNMTNETAAQDAQFGNSVDLSSTGKVLAVGAPQMNTTNGGGAVRVYDEVPINGNSSIQPAANQTNSSFTGIMWGQRGHDIVGDAGSVVFGWSVALNSLDGQRIAIGDPGFDIDRGRVQVFDWNGTAWQPVGGTLSGEINLGRFGGSLALSADGTVLAVGGRGIAFGTGTASIYRESNGIWIKDTNVFLGTQKGENFGASVSLSSDGNTLAIGGPKNDEFGKGSGHIQVWSYNVNTGAWTQEGSSIGGSEGIAYGSSVSISANGTRVVGGAPSTVYDGSVPEAGSVRVYDRAV